MQVRRRRPGVTAAPVALGASLISSVRRARNHRGMWQVTVLCTDCAEEADVVVEDLDDVEREACPCGYSLMVLSVAGFEAEYAEEGELVELAPRRALPIAA